MSVKKFKIQFGELMSKSFVGVIRLISSKIPKSLSVKMFNIISRKVKWGISGNKCFVEEGSCRHYFASPSRGFQLYHAGLKARFMSLAESYGIDQIKFVAGDVVIDCGANYGDLARYFELLGKQLELHLVEPSPVEAGYLEKNFSEVPVHQIAFGEREDNIVFYVNSEEADSSVVEPEHFSHAIEVKMTTLDNFISEKIGAEPIKLLKLEAEGYEPEILYGSVATLNNIEWVAVDGGYERGVKKEETLSTICNYMITHNFEMTFINFSRCTALFHNRAKKI
jgi:FkbM family methyltransferase